MVVFSILWKIKGAFCLFDFYKAIISIALISDYMMKCNETFTVKKRRGKKKKEKKKKERKKDRKRRTNEGLMDNRKTTKNLSFP